MFTDTLDAVHVHQPAPISPSSPTLTGRSVSLEQAAALLGVSRRTIYYRIREGRLQTIRTRNGSQRVLLESLQELGACEPQPRATNRPHEMAAR